MQRVKAFSPATVANIGVGFDVLGMAVDAPGDVVIAERREQPGVEIVEITGDGGKLPYGADKNTASLAASAVLSQIGEEGYGVRLWVEKGLPLASGLGSSAASAVAAAVATNALFGDMLLREDLLPAVLAAESVIAGRHADNVAPALLGGVVLITGLSIGEIHRLPLPVGVYLALVTPQVAVATADARAILPKNVPLSVLVHQTGVVAEVVHALHEGNHHLLARAMQRDAVVEPVRSELVPKLAEVRSVATQAGALATVISGSGPTLCSLCFTEQDAEAVSRAMVGFYEAEGIQAEGRTAVPSAEGARILETTLSD